MAADMHLHLLADAPDQVGVREEDLPVLFHSTIGSRWGMTWEDIINPENWDEAHMQEEERNWEEKSALYHKLARDGNIWVGEVSWLKAALFEDEENFIPDAIGTIQEIIDEQLPVIDDALIEKIDAAMQLPNTTTYSLNNAGEILDWLKAHRGRRVFTMSW